jgi:nascent polypeptide-associated complex subunit alpha
MMPNMDPRALKRMMDSMGMKTSEVAADRVVIEGKEKNIIIENPSVTMIEVQGNTSFQIAGTVSEMEKSVKAEITDDDIKTVMDQTNKDKDTVRKALEETNGDIAEAIIKLKGE